MTQGVHGFDGSFQLYRETNVTASAWWNSPYELFCPYSMHSVGPQILMFNIHSLNVLGKNIDEVISCANNRSEVDNLDLAEETIDALQATQWTPYSSVRLNDCAILSDMFITYDANGDPSGPSAFVVQPIYPANDNDVVSYTTWYTVQLLSCVLSSPLCSSYVLCS